MHRYRTFIERALNGEVFDPSSEIEDAIEAWHSSDSNASLADWLGMTPDEYSQYVECSSALPAILYARAQGRTAL